MPSAPFLPKGCRRKGAGRLPIETALGRKRGQNKRKSGKDAKSGHMLASLAQSPRGSCAISTSASSLLIEFTKAHFEQVDQGRLPDELFTPDFEFYFPKYGVGRGFEEFRELAAGLASAGLKVTHHRDRLRYIACGRQVIVERTTFGSDGAANMCDGGETPGGRFSSVFEVTEDGFIERIFIYLDPDFASRDPQRLNWRRSNPRW